MAKRSVVPVAPVTTVTITWAGLFEQYAPFRQAHFLQTLPARLIDLLEKEDALDADAISAERALLAICTQHRCAGVTRQVAWHYWPVDIGVKEDKLREAVCGYIAYLWTKKLFFEEWAAFRQRHQEAITRTGYPLHRLSPRQVDEHHLEEPLRAFHHEFREFTSGWGLKGMAGEKYPLPPLPQAPALEITEEMAVSEGLGAFTFTPLYVPYTPTRMLPRDSVSAAQKLQSTHMKSDAWRCQCRPDGKGISTMARGFLLTYYSSILAERWPNLLEFGDRERFREIMERFLVVSDRALDRSRMKLRAAATLRRALGLTYP